MDKKINWKKIAMITGVFAVGIIIGAIDGKAMVIGVFAAGIVIGAVSGEKILSEISLDGMSELTAHTCSINGNKTLDFSIHDAKTGRRLTSCVDKAYLGDLLEFLAPLMDAAEFK